jgi:hypothetical protein
MKRRLGSSLGIKDDPFIRRWPFLIKKFRKTSLISSDFIPHENNQKITKRKELLEKTS